MLQWHDGLKVRSRGSRERNQTTKLQQHLASCPLVWPHPPSRENTPGKQTLSSLPPACRGEEDGVNQSIEERPGAWASCCSPIHRSHWGPSVRVWLCFQSKRLTQQKSHSEWRWQKFWTAGHEVKGKKEYLHTGLVLSKLRRLCHVGQSIMADVMQPFPVNHHSKNCAERFLVKP